MYIVKLDLHRPLRVVSVEGDALRQRRGGLGATQPDRVEGRAEGRDDGGARPHADERLELCLSQRQAKVRRSTRLASSMLVEVGGERGAGGGVEHGLNADFGPGIEAAT